MKAYHHDINRLDEEARRLIATHVNDAAGPPYVQHALDTTAADSTIVEIIGAMTRYAQEGRFHNLDYLAGRNLTDDSPAELWHDLQSRIIGPRLLAGLPPADAARVTNETVAQSIRNWVSCYHVAWQHGVFGQGARQRSAMLGIAGSQPV